MTRETAAASVKGDLPRLFGVVRWADRTAITLSLAAAGVLAIGALVFVRDAGSPVARAMLVGAPLVPLVALMKIRGAALQGLTFIVRGQMPNELVRPLLFSMLLFLLFMAMPDAGAAEAMVLNVLTAAIGLVFAFAWLRTRWPGPRPEAVIEDGRTWMRSAVPMALMDGLRILQSQLVIIILGLMLTTIDVGLYRIATSTTIIVGGPMTLVGSVTAPILARLHAEGDRRRLQLLSFRSAQATTAGVLALSLPIFLFGRQLITLLFGAEYAPAFPALAVLCAGQVVHCCFGPNGILLIMSGHERRVTRATFLSLLLCIAGLLILVPPFGLIGAALATVLSILAWNLLCWWDALQRLGIVTSIFGGRLSRRAGQG